MGSQDPPARESRNAEERPDPRNARSPAELAVAMQQLMEWSGLTLRQLEQMAEVHGDVLTHSTLTEVLRRQSLPRPETLTAFVRACGAGEQVNLWLEARRRISARDTHAPGAGPRPGAPPAPRPEGGRPSFPRLPLLWGTATALLVAVGVWILVSHGSSSPSTGTAAQTPSAVSPAEPARSPAPGWSRIQPVGSPASCLTEGHDAKGLYPSAVAVQGPCTGSTQPRTRLEAVGDGLFYIQWENPDDAAIGCLTVVDSGVVKDFLAPWDDCGATRLSQHFRMEAVDQPVPGGYRIRPAHSGLCVSIVSQTREAVQKPCDGEAWQEYFIGPA
ncbi:helix-turn-helix domain-containing protein [Streptomyces sp. NPDC008125]|uniref:RICIN domain-containing protein n=1 Tax=Streptomyces sp. NPDC008125 TaxID=3364811 RepID=UPI0036E84193